MNCCTRGETSIKTAGLVFDIRRYSINDGPGIRTTVFFKGCPLRCLWCHNPEGQLPDPELIYRKERCILCGECLEICPEHATFKSPEGIGLDGERCRLCGACAEHCPAEAREIVGKRMTVDEVSQEIERDRPYFDESGGGVTFSGGEPLAQADFLVALLEICRKQGIHSAVDTSGYAPTSVFTTVAAKTDLVLFDLKHMDSGLHRRYTGVGNETILSNLSILAQGSTPFRVRIPLVPGFNDDVSNLEMTGRFLETLGQPVEIDLLPFHRAARDKHLRFAKAYSLPEVPSHSEIDLAGIRQIFEDRGFKTQIGG